MSITSPARIVLLLSLLPALAFGQWGSRDKNASAPRGFESFHSNLGQQGIVDLMERPAKVEQAQQPASAPLQFAPLGSLRGSPVVVPPKQIRAEKKSGWGKQDEQKSGPSTGLTVFAGTRPYHTDNVLRTKSNEVDSGVWENNVGGSLSGKPVEVGSYFTMIPRLDLILQWSNYGEDSVSDVLDYRFGMIKASAGIALPKDWILSPGFEYSVLHGQSSGDKMFDALSPSLQIQKVFGLSQDTFLMVDGMLKISNTDRVMNFQAEGIFADDGDNFQSTLNLSLVRTYGDNGQYVLMPAVGITRSAYLKNLQDGRVDMVLTAGLSGIWQAKDWLSLQVFGNYSTLTTNSHGKSLLGESSSFHALEVGVSATATHAF